MDRRYLEILFSQLLARRDFLKKIQSEPIEDIPTSIVGHELTVDVTKHQIEQFEMLIDEYLRLHKRF